MTCLCPDLIIAACCDPSPQPTAKITRLAAVIVEVRESMNLDGTLEFGLRCENFREGEERENFM